MASIGARNTRGPIHHVRGREGDMAAWGWTYKRCPHGVTGTPKRGNRASVRACREKHGSWYWRVEGPRKPDGSREMPSKGGYRTQDEAEEALQVEIERMNAHPGRIDRTTTLKVWLERWLKEGTWGPSTRRSYESQIRLYLVPLLGDVRLCDLTKKMISDALKRIATGEGLDQRTEHGPGYRGGLQRATKSGSSVDAARRVLRSALSSAMEEDLITWNPAMGSFKRAIPSRTAKQRAFWQPSETAQFLDATALDPDVVLWVVLTDTGLRRSEVLGVRWDAVDLTSTPPGLWVRWKVIDHPGWHPCPICEKQHRGRLLAPGSKTEAGTDRWVPLTTASVTELIAHQAAQEALRQELGDHWDDHGLVFPSTPTSRDPGAPRRPAEVTKRHAALVAEHELPTTDLHGKRHAVASALTATGMPLDQAALVLGHSSGRFTQERYVHGMQETLAEGAQAASDLIRRSRQK